MVMLFAFLVCLCVIVLLTCIWKLVRIFAKVQVEKQIEELEELSLKDPTDKTDSLQKPPLKKYMSPKEARKFRRLSVVAGFDQTLSRRRANASFSPFRFRSTTRNPDLERSIVTDDSITNETTEDTDDVIMSQHDKYPGLFLSLLTCGCCIPIHERLSKLLLRQLSEREQIHDSRRSITDKLISKRSKISKLKIPGSPRHRRCKQNQIEESEQHLDSTEEIVGTGNTLGEKGKYKVRKETLIS